LLSVPPLVIQLSTGGCESCCAVNAGASAPAADAIDVLPKRAATTAAATNAVMAKRLRRRRIIGVLSYREVR